VKGYPFEVSLPNGLEVQGVILSDQLKSLDWKARRAKLIGRVPPEVLDETVGKLLSLIDPEEGARYPRASNMQRAST
jgi:mRNA interferase MazF